MSKKRLYYIFHKPYKVLSQFTDENGNPGLGSLLSLPSDVYPVGRLDLDSEGLLLLTNDKSLNHKLLHPSQKHERTYWVQLEGNPDDQSLSKLVKGVTIRINGKEIKTLPAQVRKISPDLSERNPPVNYKKHPETSWVELKLTEGKNRQVRRMTAAIGHPTLRLVRSAIESIHLLPLQPGEISQISRNVLLKKLKIAM